MCVCGAAGGALWALIAGVLKAFARTNEIITTLMLNYVAGLLLTYLIFDSASPWRDVSTIQTRSFPQSVALKPSQFWPTVDRRRTSSSRSGSCSRSASPSRSTSLFRLTRFGFEMNVIGDSQRAARYSGMRTRRKILAVMAISGAIAGLGGASQVGDFSHVLDASPQGLQGAELRLHRDRRRGARAATTRSRSCWSASCSAACRTRGSSSRAPTSRPASSA